MVSIGAFIKLLLLVSFVLCTKEEFSKLSDAEITETLSKCGKFKDLKEGISKTKDDVLLAYISPRHFLTDIRILTNYHSMECGTRGNSVSNFLNTTGNFSAKLIGECKNEPTGMILGDSHPENKHPQDKWFCVRNNKMEINEDVQVVMGANVDVSAKVVQCPSQKPSIFCLKAFKGTHGFVISGKNAFSIVGIIIGPTKDNDTIFEAFFLHYRSKALCDFSGICETSSQTTSTPQQTSTTSINSTSVVPTTFQPTTIQNSNVTLSTTVSISATATTGNSLTKEPATTASLSTPSPQSTESITVNHQTTIKVPSTPDQRPTTIPPAIPSKVTVPSHPQAEALKSLEVDCEEENLCFEEDIFAFVAGANSILNSLAIFFIVFLFQ
ncbi:hypothetical protein L3Y34_014486 [Caenorhabditis briggsae]|uniref:Uncharacterized protein n=1 Tax=Caenorhabditis briggsae TaxID=6238 RepID=A0AAE9IYC2_CAEBR|nr:hypothetical protein L3Y34_014486 [Caenorhabditis briggsae]